MKEKLFELSTDGFKFPVASTTDGVIMTPAGLLPIIFWPDKTACWEANLFILKGYRRGLSRRVRGGTLREHAKHVSHLIRFCFNNKVNFIDLTDSQFTLFVRGLIAERKPTSPELPYRENAQVIVIVKTCLAFLSFIQSLYPKTNLIGDGGNIRIENKLCNIKTTYGIIQKSYLYHHAMPTPDAPRERQPISAKFIDKLIAANREISPSTFIRRRRYVMLRLFEVTGARRIEVANLKVDDVFEAKETRLIPVFTAKKRSDKHKRYIPVSSADLKIFIDFVEKYRRRTFVSTFGHRADHGFLLISETSGNPLSVETLSNELAILRRAAKIDSETVLHSFRHRYITKIFVWLIQEHKYSNEGDARAAILSTETIKRKVMEWSGHSDIRSLERYIHLAFAEVSSYKHTLNVIAAMAEIESAISSLEEQRSEIIKADPVKVVEILENTLNGVLEKLRSISNPT